MAFNWVQNIIARMWQPKTNLDSLPTELHRRICSFLDPSDAASLRLVSRHYAAVGIECYLPEVYVMFHRKSFERLLAISQHPVVSKHVKSIFYEPLQLEEFDSYDRWHAEAYGADDSDEDQLSTAIRAPGRPSKWISDKCRPHWNAYQALRDDQRRMRKESLDFLWMAQAIRQFSSLASFTVSTGYWLEEGHDAQIEGAFGASLVKPHNTHDRTGPECSRELQCMLEATRENLGLRGISAGTVHWRCFDPNIGTFALDSAVYSSLTKLHMTLSLLHDFGDQYGQDSVECRELLRTGVVKDFLKAMTKLQELSIGFDTTVDEGSFLHAAPLEDILPNDHTWPNLHSLSIRALDADRNGFLEFLSRHKDTLTHLGLEELKFRCGGDWHAFLPAVRDLLVLTDATIGGELLGGDEGDDDFEVWTVSDFSRHGEEDDHVDERKGLLASYLIRATDICPLNRENMNEM